MYFAHHCFFLPLLMLHMPVGIQTAAATSKITKDPACIREIQVHKLWTKVYSQKGLTAMNTRLTDRPPDSQTDHTNTTLTDRPH